MSQINTVYQFQLDGLKDNSKEGLTPRFDAVLTKVVGNFNAQNDETHTVTADNVQWHQPGIMTATFHGSSGRDVQQCAMTLSRLLCASLKASTIAVVVAEENESRSANLDGLDAVYN